MNSLIDSHCHLMMKSFDKDRLEVVNRAKSAGIDFIINIGIDMESNLKGIEFAEKHRMVYTTVGIHPHHAKDADNEAFEQLKQLASSPHVVAIGETGLDYHYMHSPKEVQRNIFMKHLELAQLFDLPVVVHTREAEEDTLNILKKVGQSVKGVIHCFSGTIEMAKRAIDMNLYLSISGIVTFRKADELRDVAKIVPNDLLLIETDAPYLSPHPKRGKRNEPSFLVHTAYFSAELRDSNFLDIAKMTSKNAKDLFKFDRLP